MPKFQPTVALVALLALASSLPAAQIAGYGRDGTRVYPDCSPPTQWGTDDVDWETPLPSWGNGSLCHVDGRVFALCEPSPAFDFPLLVCLDAASGKILWQREVDHLPATGLDDAEQQAIHAKWHAYINDYYERNRLTVQWKNADDQQAFEAKLKADGYKLDGRQKFVNNDGERLAEEKAVYKELHKKAGFVTNVSQHSQGCGLHAVGLGFATPCSDGKRVYAMTAFGGMGCFDLDGNQLWVGWVNGDKSTEGCNAARSPILWAPPGSESTQLAISDLRNVVRAWDAKTGELKWSHSLQGDSHAMVSPMVLRVGEQEVLLAAGCNAYTLPEGRPLKVEGWYSEGMQTLVKHDERDVAFFCGAGEHCGWIGKGSGMDRKRGQTPASPAAFRFTLEDDVLKASLIWDGRIIAKLAGCRSERDAYGGTSPWMVYDEGRFYHVGGAVLNALTGEVLAGSIERRRRGLGAVPATQHLLAIAGGHVYGLDSRNRHSKRGPRQVEVTGTMAVCTVDGTPVAENPVPRSQPTEAQKLMLQACVNRDDPNGFSYGCGFTFGGERIFLRSWTSVVCIGDSE